MFISDFFSKNFNFKNTNHPRRSTIGKRTEKVADLKTQIIAIETEVVDLTWTGELLVSPKFQAIYQQPEDYMTQVLELLSDPGFTEQQKIIAALALQKLPLPKLVAFDLQMLSFCEQGLIPDTVLEWAVFPPYDWNTKLAENYTRAEVRDLLLKFSTSSVVSSERKQFIQSEILTGNAKKQIKLLRETGQLK
jgi:hypothetical protein